MIDFVMLYVLMCLVIFFIYIRMEVMNDFFDLIVMLAIAFIPGINIISLVIILVEHNVTEKIFNLLTKDIF